MSLVGVVTGFGRRNTDGTHTIFFKEIVTPPYNSGEDEEIRLTQLFNLEIENFIREDPTQWAWFHRRWKHQPDKAETDIST